MSGERRGGFTLIEILAAVAVVGVLVGMLAPALAGVRDSAHAGLCAANLRQLQLAAGFYAEDHRGRMPPGAREFRANLNRWHGTRQRLDEAFSSAGAPLTPYLENAAVSAALRECPGFAHEAGDLREAGAGFERSAGGYGYNNAFVGVVRERRDGAWHVADDSHGSRLARFASPAATLGFSDAALLVGRVIEYSFAEPRVWPDYPGYAPDPSVHFRHAGAANVAWLDTHVSRERLGQTEPGWQSEGHAGAAGLGWPGDCADNRLFDYD